MFAGHISHVPYLVIVSHLTFSFHRKTHGFLTAYFENIEMEVAEEALCQFEDMYKELR
jgi:hypothetical protein